MTELWPGGPIELPHRFRHDGVDLVLPTVPNATLLDLLTYGRWSHFYPGLIPEGHGWELELRYADPTDVAFEWHQFHWVARTLLGRIAGTMRQRPGQADDDGYLAARVLSGRVLFNWPEFAAWCARHGFNDPMDRPFWLLMGAAYGWQQEAHATSAELLAELDRMLWPPRPALPPPPEADPEAEAEHAAPRAPGERPAPVIPQHLLDEEQDFVLAELRDMGLVGDD